MSDYSENLSPLNSTTATRGIVFLDGLNCLATDPTFGCEVKFEVLLIPDISSLAIGTEAPSLSKLSLLFFIAESLISNYLVPYSVAGSSRPFLSEYNLTAYFSFN